MNKDFTAPMFKNKYLAHALGGYNGYKYLNNETALKHSIRNRHKFYEIDLSLTTDNHVVPSHGWTPANAERSGMTYSADFESMTKELFLKQTVHDMPTMDTELLYSYMKKNKSFYWELDLHKLSKTDASSITKALINDFHNDEELFGRFLVQVNSKEMYEGIESIYHFKYYQYLLYKGTTPEELDSAIGFCKTHGIISIALSVKDASREYLTSIKDAGLCILIYSTDKAKLADELYKMGADTICTNTLSPRLDSITKFKNLFPIKILRKIKRKLF